MSDIYQTIVQLTSAIHPPIQDLRLLNDFAYELGWRPSDRLDVPYVRDLANIHLVVEHGLQNTAVISFLRNPLHFAGLNHTTQNRLLSVSYNSLVDWHVQVHADQISYVFNRTQPVTIVEQYPLSQDTIDKLHSEILEELARKSPPPNLPSLDAALIETISFWKRNLSASLGHSVNNEALSALFNAIIFLRAAEDHLGRLRSPEQPRSKALVEAWENSSTTIRDVLVQALAILGSSEIPQFVVDDRLLHEFDSLDRTMVASLLKSFYQHKYVPYEYDFSIISKQALSRIYEHYVSLLRLTESSQLAFFPDLPEEERNKAYGSIYTPQFVARYFARYLRDNMPPQLYRRISAVDPACGSGIFLRTLLELQCDPTQDGITTDLIQNLFQNVLALDVDANACQATRLSLSLLHLVLTNTLPTKLNVISAEEIQYFDQHPELTEGFDVVMANPPFVSLDTQSESMRKLVRKFMAECATGRIDLYLPFLRMALEMLKPGGYGLFVLPHSFLLAKNASQIRRLLHENTWICSLADLSAIRVFGETGSYIILLIFRKKSGAKEETPPATIIKCQELVGSALQDAVEGRTAETNFYSIYKVEQEVFGRADWSILPPAESSVRRRLEMLPRIVEFFEIRQGFVSGLDQVFIIPRDTIPKGEESIFVPYLADRQMKRYDTAVQTSEVVFYPYIEDRRLQDKEVERKFPKTWRYLLSHKKDLEKRSPVQKKQLPWWMPVRPRSPQHLMRPKIVTPHLVLTPRFSLDQTGKYAVSRSPFLYPKKGGAEDDLLKFFLAVLNSSACFWYIAAHSHRYRGGYVMLEVKTLRETPVPDPTQLSTKTMKQILDLVESRLLNPKYPTARDLEKRIDELLANVYGLSPRERQAIGMEK